MIPRLPDYVRCFALMAIPAVATTMAIIFLRTSTKGVQSSLYVVYLKGVGLTGTSIGVLFAAIEITSGLGSLVAGRAMRLGDPQRTMLSGTVLSILLICATPFTGGIFALLFVAQTLRGWLQGVVQPMMFSLQAKAVGPYRQGSVVLKLIAQSQQFGGARNDRRAVAAPGLRAANEPERIRQRRRSRRPDVRGALVVRRSITMVSYRNGMPFAHS